MAKQDIGVDHLRQHPVAGLGDLTFRARAGGVADLTYLFGGHPGQGGGVWLPRALSRGYQSGAMCIGNAAIQIPVRLQAGTCRNGLHRGRASHSAAPPSTVIMDPVIIDASSDAANKNVLAMSSGVQSLPKGV